MLNKLKDDQSYYQAHYYVFHKVPLQVLRHARLRRLLSMSINFMVCWLVYMQKIP